MNILPRARKIFFSALTPNQEPLTDGKTRAFFRTMMREDEGTVRMREIAGFVRRGATGFSLAVFMANSGGAWDNAKKMVEEGNFGGKGSEQHKATVVGDTVGDPFKDTSGPSLNILIKLMSMVSIVMAGLTVALA